MKRLCYYLMNCEEVDIACEKVRMEVPCFVQREYIEMNYSEIVILCREEDARFVEAVFASVV